MGNGFPATGKLRGILQMAQPTFRQWLKRGKKAKKPRHPLKRKKRLNSQSAKRAKEGAIYREQRKDFLEMLPLCEAWSRILDWAVENHCVVGQRIPSARPRSSEVHHVKRRGKHFLDQSSWMAVSSWAHRWIHAHPKEAQQIGLLA